MSFWDDVSMGLGLKEKDDAYRERTAQNLERQGNQRGANQVRAQMTGGSSPSAPAPTSGGGGAPSSSLRPVLRPDRDASGNVSWSGDSAPTRAQLNPASTADPYVDMTTSEELMARAGNVLNPMNLLRRGAEYLGGVDRSNDRVVAVIDGQEIYQREDGTTYSYNRLGLPYDTAGLDTLAEDPSSAQQRERMMMGSDNEPMPVEEEIAAEDAIDPCPEGYVFDSEQQICVIDPDVGFISEPVVPVDPYTPQPLSDYTQVTNNFIPTPLSPTAPNPLEQQLQQMQQQISGGGAPRGQSRSGLAGTTLNTGIMQGR